MADYINKKFNHLTVLSQIKKKGIWYFVCRCDCGCEKTIQAPAVKFGHTKTCGLKGCIYFKKSYEGRKQPIDCVGQKFNHLMVLSQQKKNDKWYALCRCDCGREKKILAGEVRRGKQKTCGEFSCEYRKKLLAQYYAKKIKDCVGKKYNALEVISHYMKAAQEFFLCRCDCGQEREFYAWDVRGGYRKTCGKQACVSKIRDYLYMNTDFSGRKFNRLTIVSQYRDSKKKITYFHCVCDCGTKITANACTILHDQSKSCGCLQKEAACETVKKSPPIVTLAENSSVFIVLTKLGYRKDGRKIGVLYIKDKRGSKGYWAAICKFQKGKEKHYRYNTYPEAEKKRHELQEQIFIPFIQRNKHLLPEDTDINYFLNRNSEIKFDWKQHEESKKGAVSTKNKRSK